MILMLATTGGDSGDLAFGRQGTVVALQALGGMAVAAPWMTAFSAQQELA